MNVLQAVQVYAGDAYGAILWDLNGKNIFCGQHVGSGKYFQGLLKCKSDISIVYLDVSSTNKIHRVVFHFIIYLLLITLTAHQYAKFWYKGM